MNYSAMLGEIIHSSNLSLRQISKRCADLNLHITPSYISQLKNGKLPPPSEEVSLILAKVCGSENQAKLVFQGYMEKAPHLVRESMRACFALNKLLLESLYKADNGEISSELKEHIASLDVLSTLTMSSEYLRTKKISEAQQLLKKDSKSIQLPQSIGFLSNSLHLLAADEAMAPFIPKGACVTVIPGDSCSISNHDVVAFYPAGSAIPALRRLYVINNQTLLLPDDRSFELYSCETLEQLRYIGKVVSYEVKL